MCDYTRRHFLRTAGMSTLLLGMPFSCGRKNQRPNIVFILSDDQRADTIHALNNPAIRTPHLDSLVRSGLTFTNAYIMGGTSGAVCMPSRAMTLTGRTLFHLQNQGGKIPVSHVMMPEWFRAYGYETFGTGKWHNGREAYARCFSDGGNIFFGGMSDHTRVPVFDFDPSGRYPREERRYAEGYSSEIFMDEAIEFIRSRSTQEPFFLYVALTAPHDPRQAPDRFKAMYPAEEMTLPENFIDQHPFNNGEMTIRDENLAAVPRDPDEIRSHIADYYAIITHMDEQVGRLMGALNDSGLTEDTIIVYAADNGLAIGSHGLMGKQNLYEHSIHVPVIFSGPSVPKGEKSEALCYLLDLFPTLCEMAGLKKPESIDGISLLPVIESPKRKGRDEMFFAYRHLQRALRTLGGWKLIVYNLDGVQRKQLFFLPDDPLELNDLSGEETMQEQIAEMEAKLGKKMKALDDFCDPGKPDWGVVAPVYKKQKVTHIALKADVVYTQKPDPRYKGEGSHPVTNGVRGTSNFKDGSWVGFEGSDLEGVIDLGSIKKIGRIKAGFLEDQDSWIFFPRSFSVALSKDGKAYSPEMRTGETRPKQNSFAQIRDLTVETEPVPARYVRIRAENVSVCPEWHRGAGGKAWLFIDEIMIW